MIGDNRIKFFLQFLNLTGCDFNIRSLSLRTAHRLVNHHAWMRQCRAFAFGTGYQQYGSHRSSHTCTDSSNITWNKLHGIVNTQSGIHTTARRIDIDRDILARVYRVQIEQLRLKRVCRIVIYLCTQKNNAIHHQSGEYIELSYIQLSLFENIGIQIPGLRFNHIVQHHAIHS